MPEAGGLGTPEARALLRLKLSSRDVKRADQLAAKARAGKLTAAEERELDDCLAIGSALEFLKSKARMSLRRAGARD
ncbi:MAG: hypothetical protein HY736_02140 [Verrucomicrobia bacterium]|nr:hypothetical protein [Verrucomicrobiota bacterium]